MPDTRRPVVAVFNSSLETLEVIRELLQEEGLYPITAHVDDVRLGKLDLLEFMRVHDPAVLVWDVAPPYAENWRLLQLILAVPEVGRRPVVLTTTNERALREAVGVEGVHEIVGKPYDMRELLGKIRSRLPS